MFKTIKKAISILLIASFVLSLVPVVSFAAADPFPWIGSNKPNFRGYRATINEDGTVTKGTGVEGTSEHYNIVLDHKGVFGKKANDTVYKVIEGINNAGPSSATATYASGGADFTLSGNFSKITDSVLELSLCFENAASIFSTLDGVQFWKDWANSSRDTWGWAKKPSESFIYITSSNLKFADISVPYNFVPGRWYNFTFVCDFENTSDGSKDKYNYQAYVNGEKLISNSTTRKVYGFRTFRMGSLSYDGDLWIDNISAYTIPDANSFICPEAKTPVLSSNNADITIDSATDSVIVQKTTKFQILKQHLA